MPDRFVAIDVEEGDAFFLEIVQDDSTVRFLVDGGRNHTPFHQKFLAATGVTEVDVMVCTHNDADHVLGLVDFLRSPSFKAEEVWLPADWLADVTRCLQDPSSYLWECLKELRDLSSEDLKDLLDRLDDPDHEPVQDTEFEEVQPTEALVLEGSEDIDQEQALGIAMRFAFLFSHPRFFERELSKYPQIFLLPPQVRNFLLAFITKVQQLSELVSCAILRGCRLRWFEYDDHHPKGPRNDFVPLNAREVPFPNNVVFPASKLGHPHTSRMLQYQLKRNHPNRINRRALVFALEGTDTRPPVLYSSDSDYAFAVLYPGRVPWHDGMLITTPHHGANSNVRLSQLFNQQRKGLGVPSIWVRSDMARGPQNKTRPSVWYTKYLKASAKRYCTICSLPQAQYQVLHLAVVNGKWDIAPSQTAQVCQCP